ncbi:superoxide dismutase [Vibrio anguillarum]|nr:superoxide dismutase [Vibrio anguillarum]NNN97525.1 superoxide dismutase [Vibrio sp. B4-6]
MFTVCFFSSVVRCQPLSRALYLIYITHPDCMYIHTSVLVYYSPVF